VGARGEVAGTWEERQERWRQENIAIDSALRLGPKSTRETRKNNFMAQNLAWDTVRDDDGPPLNLQKRAIDTLIFHSRQDVAWCAMNTVSIWEQLRVQRRILIFIALVNVLILCRILFCPHLL